MGFQHPSPSRHGSCTMPAGSSAILMPALIDERILGRGDIDSPCDLFDHLLRPDLAGPFLWWSSGIVLVYGLCYAIGTWAAWPRLSGVGSAP